VLEDPSNDESDKLFFLACLRLARAAGDLAMVSIVLLFLFLLGRWVLLSEFLLCAVSH
jgi:hypothetical protein